jgi:hypothetical protein
MSVHLPGVQLPVGATVDIHVHVSAPMNIPAYVARQKVNGFVILEISDYLRGEQPELIVSDRRCWLGACGTHVPDSWSRWENGRNPRRCYDGRVADGAGHSSKNER